MTVGATHGAFIDLAPDGRSGLPSEHLSNGPEFVLWINVIEVENDWIRFAAVNARVSQQVLVDKVKIRQPVAHLGSDVLL